MDILRTPVGKKFCSALNTRERRSARRRLVRQRKLMNVLMQRFNEACLTKLTPVTLALDATPPALSEMINELPVPELVPPVFSISIKAPR